MEKCLLEKDPRFWMAQELSLDGFALLKAVRDAKGEIRDFIWDYLNPAAAKIFKAEAKFFLGKKVSTTLPGWRKSGIFSDCLRVFKQGQGCDIEVSYELDKAVGWLRVMVVKVEDGVAVFLRDITEKKIWEKELQQSEARFRVIAESNMIALAFWDEKGIILDANEVFLKLLDYEREELLSRTLSWRELTPKEYWGVEEAAKEEVKENGSCKPFEKEYLRKDGQRLSVLVGEARLKSISFEGVTFVVDVTERKEFEKQREIFLGHELKNPLAGIKGFAQLSLKHLAGSGEEKVVANLQKIEQKVDFLTNLINDLTDLTRLRNNKMEFNDEVFEFDDLAKEIVEDFCLTCEEKVILEGKTKQFLLADKDKINQVLMNLLTNAVKYSPQKDKVIVRLGVDHKHLQVEVQDFGIGMTKEDQEKVFTPFYRTQEAKELTSGVGLGLYICQGIIKHYGGEFKVVSERGKGSIVGFQIPLNQPAGQSK
ncbi:MAG: PAS domain-containing sensor histidine kinase [Patescibacteria group bacterium]|nr:PAS domain-containing sensor histidine kinase [Patescibacteria group bacterium]